MLIEPSSWATYFVARGSSFFCSVGCISLGSFSITRVSLVAIRWTFDVFRKLHVDQCAHVEQVSLVIIPIPTGCLLVQTLWSILLNKLSHDMRKLGLKGCSMTIHRSIMLSRPRYSMAISCLHLLLNEKADISKLDQSINRVGYRESKR